jgi:uncharacterized membrane protein
MDINININLNKNSKKITVNFILIAILIVASFLRLYNLGFQSPWLDEITTMQLSDPSLPLEKTLELIDTRDAFSIVYYGPLKLLCSVFGHSIYLIRFFSAFFGIMSVLVIYLLVKELINKKTAYIAALLLTVNYFHINYSQEARSYSLLLFFALFASYRLIKFVNNNSTINAIILGLSIGLIPTAHPLGILNILTILGFMFIMFFVNTNKKEKIKLLKLYLITGVASLVTFSLAISKLITVSKINSFWIEKPTFDSIKLTFFDILGKDDLLFYLYIFGIVSFFILFFISKKNKKQANNKVLYLLVTIWIIMNIGLIIAKSYLHVSIIQSRYFIGSVPIFIITLAYVLGRIKNNYLCGILVICITGYSLFNLFFVKNYYKTVTKSEWNLVSPEIIKRNTNQEKIIGSFGYVLNGLYVNTNCAGLGWEITLENYVNSLKNNEREKESFWYIDGNFKPYNLKQEDSDFLSKYYEIDYQIDKYDCWAKHYRLKSDKSSNTQNSDIKNLANNIYLKDFDAENFDNQGKLMLFENKTISSRSLNLEKGTFELVLNANSLPAKPIENTNAHIIIKHNDQIIGNCFLSEKSEKKENKFKFVNQDLSSVFTIIFDNDLAKNNLDRNVIIYSIALNKLKK